MHMENSNLFSKLESMQKQLDSLTEQVERLKLSL
jgi:hypothetical protein